MKPEPHPIRPEAPAPDPNSMAAKWKKASSVWAREVRQAYISNPATLRDFRVQFRGKGNPIVFGLLVALFSCVTLVLMYQIGKNGGLNPATIQEMLTQFCGAMLAIVGACVILIAPAMASVSILVEKQRRSLDLVFSSPIKPSSYLFGKLIASYRYIWVLMALSLPFTAMSIIMGGGTWLNILEAYFLLSLQGLLYASIGIYFSALVEKTLNALLYTYLSIIGLAGLFAAIFASSGLMNNNSPLSGGQGPFTGGLVPLLVEYATGTFTPIGPFQVPNTLISLVFTAGFVSIVLKAAGGLISPLRARERTGLRVQFGLIMAALGVYAGYVDIGIPNSAANGVLYLLATIPLLVFVPFLACYDPNGERRQNHAGLFSIRDMFGRSVAGALPYIYFLLSSLAVGFFAGSVLSEKLSVSIPAQLAYVAFGFAFWTFAWAAARFASSFLLGIKASRTFQFLMMIAFVGAPLPIFAALTEKNPSTELMNAIWQFSTVGPFFLPGIFLPALIHAAILFGGGTGLVIWSEKNYRKRLEKRTLERMAAEPTPLTLTPSLNDLVKDESLVQRLVQGS